MTAPPNGPLRSASGMPEPAYVDVARAAVREGWTRAQVIEVLLSRMRRDKHYLAYRAATGKHTVYDEETAGDQRALALAVCWLDEADPLGSGSVAVEDTSR